jgi:RNA polymerase sigma-70 factor (ECF subfamily)
MSDSAVNSAVLCDWLARMRAGDRAAREDLFRTLGGQLERQARAMLRRFPAVRRWVETDDVLHNALLRLLRALREVEPASTREFFGLAALQMRRELLNLARQCAPKAGPGVLPPTGDATLAAAVEPADEGDDPAELERWCRFHQAVEGLPAEEREVVGLVYYHGWTQAEVAGLFGVSERTVRRRWETALVKLQRLLAGPG